MADPPPTTTTTTTTTNRQQQADELILLSSMFPTEFQWSLTPAPDLSSTGGLLHLPTNLNPEFTITINPSYMLQFLLPAAYPSTAKPTVTLTCSSSVSTVQRKAARAALQHIIDGTEPGVENLDVIISSFQDALHSLPLSSTGHEVAEKEGEGEEEERRRRRRGIKRVVIWTHHLLATSKRRAILAWSKELRLAGYSRPGYPGSVFVEGEVDDVDEFVGRLKEMKWQALQVRAEEVGQDRLLEVEGGVEEVEGLGDIVARLRSRGRGEVEEMFLEGMKIGKTDER